MKKLMMVATAALIFTACSGPKQFRKLAVDEKASVKDYRKRIPKKDNHYYVLIMTSMGNMVVKLFDETPLHRDNFMHLVKAGFYDSLSFHRVINNFMIQGGDPATKPATMPGKMAAGSDSAKARIPAEFKTDIGIYHQRGALAAARDNNPEKASSYSQFYIVQHPAWRPSELDSMATSRNLVLNATQRKIYTTLGGSPHLDGNYTVFGQLVFGYDVLDTIAMTKTQAPNRPTVDVRMRMFILRNKK